MLDPVSEPDTPGELELGVPEQALSAARGLLGAVESGARLLHRLIATPARRSEGFGPRRIALALVLVGGLCLAPISLDPGAAGWVAAAVLTVGALAAFGAGRAAGALIRAMSAGRALTVRGRTLQVPELTHELAAWDACSTVLRRVGLALPAVLFFCGWALVYTVIWATAPDACSLDLTHACAGAFQGAGAHPTFGDFMYFSVNMAFANPAPDLIAHSRLAHTAETVEMLSGVLLVTVYAGAFFGLGASRHEGPARDSVGESRGPGEPAA